MKNNNFKQIFILMITFIVSLAISISVNATAGDTSGDVFSASGTCKDKDSCWPSVKTSNYSNVLYGIRVTIVDGDGQMVSSKSIDYIGGNQSVVDYINSNKNYKRCLNSNSNYRNKLSYLREDTSCTWQNHDGTIIAKYLDWLPNIFSTSTAAGTIKSTILGMDEETLKTTFFNDIGYDIDSNRPNIENHYLIIEPITLVELGNTKYYGTYYELGPKTITYDWVYTVGTIFLPNSIYSIGNTEIKGSGGYDSSTGTYFKERIKIVNNDYTYVDDKGRTSVYSKYVNDQSYGYGIGIYWLKEFADLEIEYCDYNNSSHFDSNNSGPNGENCCSYVKDNLAQYGISEAEFYMKYPQCNSTLNSCKFELTTKYPTCNVDSIGNISDITDWDCIYASAYSNDTSIKNYFLKYGSPTDSCSVYCRNEVSYIYPSSGMITLAGNYFTIGNTTDSYTTYLDTNTNTIKVQAAVLGPVEISVTTQCAILGDANNTTCKNKLTEQLNNIQAPTVEFAYKSEYYNNPVEILASTSTDKTNISDGIHTKTITYKYGLPNSTYKYVSKNTGISYKTISLIGKYPYITIGNHLPIHFSQQDQTVDYQLTIKKFNLTNFDNLILEGKTMATNFETSIETYIKTLIDANMAKPVYIDNIYYLNQTFISLLRKNNFSVNDLLTSTCGNTSNYTCYSNTNGIYCYDKGKTSNSEQTYTLFNSCINSEVQKIKYQKANYSNDLLYKCSFNVVNTNTPSNGGNIIFRPISLNNPFPSTDGDGRETGNNWCYGNDCSNSNTVVEEVILNNRGVESGKIYQELDPLYKIVLTPSLIKTIKKYNNTTAYDDFNLNCDSNGNNCKSKFIRESLNNGKYNFSNYFSGCGIRNKSTGLNCSSNDAW